MMGFPYLEYLSDKGYLKDGRVRILDIGAQNLMNCTVEGMTAFVEKYHDGPLTDADREEIKRLHYFSTPRPGETTLFLSEFLDLTLIDYRAIDVCPAPATDIVDLNWQRLPDDQIASYDIVMNFGTMEHVVDQTNGLIYMHDACKVGGIIFHQPPSIGFINHGYYLYHPQFYYDLVEMNGYEMADLWYAPAGKTEALDANIEIRNPMEPLSKGEKISPELNVTDYYNLNAILKKVSNKPFALGLELATSHSAVDAATGSAYDGGTEIRRLQDEQAIKAAIATGQLQMTTGTHLSGYAEAANPDIEGQPERGGDIATDRNRNTGSVNKTVVAMDYRADPEELRLAAERVPTKTLLAIVQRRLPGHAKAAWSKRQRIIDAVQRRTGSMKGRGS